MSDFFPDYVFRSTTPLFLRYSEIESYKGKLNKALGKRMKKLSIYLTQFFDIEPVVNSESLPLEKVERGPHPTSTKAVKFNK
jgi:hypothetical protein